MKAFRKEVLVAVLILALAIVCGSGIQFLLTLQEIHRADQAADVLISETLTAVADYGNAERERCAAAAERMASLPQVKQQRLDDLHLELLMIVNPWSPLPEGYAPELATVVGDYLMDSRCAALAWQMIQDCSAYSGGLPMICSAYRTQEDQQMLYDNKVIRVMLEEYAPYEEALVRAAAEVALPGTSEHQLGLAADIIDEIYPYLNNFQETMPTQIWLSEHSPEYGFILRYPNGTSEITGIIYEPWHYRYVGEKFAREITARGITLEEYVAWRRGR
ncbi:MAG: M15 family metallopeptidase [Oscillospiraceae bacterium]|nr:M15 family metallopeptidase [Oscillospiraceae bacterium]